MEWMAPKAKHNTAAMIKYLFIYKSSPGQMIYVRDLYRLNVRMNLESLQILMGPMGFVASIAL